MLYGILVCKLNELLGLFFCVTHVLRATPEHYIVMRRRSLITSPASGFNFVADLCRYLIGFQTCIPAFELKEYGSLAIESKSVYLSLTFIYPFSISLLNKCLNIKAFLSGEQSDLKVQNRHHFNLNTVRAGSLCFRVTEFKSQALESNLDRPNFVYIDSFQSTVKVRS